MNSAVRCLLLLAAFCCASVEADESRYLLSPNVDQGSQLIDDLPAPPNSVSTVAPQRFSQKYPLRTVGSSLAIVLGAFWLLTLLFRKPTTSNKRHKASPDSDGQIMQPVETLQLNDRTQLQLVRIGSRILVLAVGDTSVQSLTEFKDFAELEQQIVATQPSHSSTVSTRQSLNSFANHPPVGDLLQRVENRLRESA
jgi:flagellar biogenesis protein FliO